MAKASILVARQARATEEIGAAIEELARLLVEMKQQLDRIETNQGGKPKAEPKAKPKAGGKS
jgi:hypothetical protein